MKTIVLLCGVVRSGKTKTLRRFFRFEGSLRSNPLLERTLDGKKVYAFHLGSPQELAHDFCNLDKVKPRIEKRIKKCEEASKGQNYTLIIPFTLSVKQGKINERCILKPIESLKARGIFRVVPIYLRKEKTPYLELKNSFMKRITRYEIKSNEDYDRQARELETLIKLVDP